MAVLNFHQSSNKKKEWSALSCAVDGAVISTACRTAVGEVNECCNVSYKSHVFQASKMVKSGCFQLIVEK